MHETISVEREALARSFYRRENAEFFWFLLGQKDVAFQIFAIEFIIRLREGCCQLNTIRLMNLISEEKRNTELGVETQPFIKTSDD